MSASAPTVALSASPTSIPQTGATNVTVTVTGSGATPSGTVVLSDVAANYVSSPAVLNNGGIAVIAVPGSALVVGSNTLTATYTPDVNSEAAYTTGSLTVTVTVTAVEIVPCKLQGYKAKLGFVPASGGAMQILFGVKNLDGEFSADELDSSDHGGSWKGRMLGLLDFSATAEVDYIAGDSGQEGFLNALLNRTPLSIYLFPAEGTGTGVDQYSGQVVIGSFKWSGKMKDLQSASISMKNASNQGFTVAAQ